MGAHEMELKLSLLFDCNKCLLDCLPGSLYEGHRRLVVAGRRASCLADAASRSTKRAAFSHGLRSCLWPYPGRGRPDTAGPKVQRRPQ